MLSRNGSSDSVEIKDETLVDSPSSNSSSMVLDRSHRMAPTARDNPSTKQEKDLELARTKSIAEALSPFREFLFVGLLCSAQFVTQAGLVNTLNILHIIGEDLGINDPGVLSWLIAGYSLTVGTFILLSGRCGDVFGYRTMVIIGFIWFAIWNVVAGCSVYVPRNGGQVLFIFARVLGGIGPAILLPNALGLLGATYNNGRKKEMIFSLFGACAPGGAVVGGTFAGLWSLLWWPWTYWTFGITLAILAVSSALILPSVPLSPEVAKLSHKKKLGELDLLGASIGITAMILFNFAWNQAPGFGWSKVYIYVLLIVGLLLFPVFFWFEMRVAKKPLIPFQALSTDVTFVLICEACGWAAFGKSSLVPASSVFACSTDSNRDLCLLLYTNTATAPWYLPTPHNGTIVSSGSIWLHRSHHDWPRDLSHWSWLGHAHIDASILDRIRTRCYHAGSSDILEASFRGHAYHTLGYGHELPCGHLDDERRCGEEVREVRV